jgi:hypothetical protein
MQPMCLSRISIVLGRSKSLPVIYTPDMLNAHLAIAEYLLGMEFFSDILLLHRQLISKLNRSLGQFPGMFDIVENVLAK